MSSQLLTASSLSAYKAQEQKECIIPSTEEQPEPDWLHLPLRSGARTFDTAEQLFDCVRDLHTAHDPEATPYVSKYAARTLLEDALASFRSRSARLTDFSSPAPPSASSTALSVLIARIEYWLGLNHLETEELSTGERHMQAALAVLTPLVASHPTAVIDGHNQLALLYTQRAHYHKAIAHLTTAQKSFQSIKPLLAPAASSLLPFSSPSANHFSSGQQRVIQRLHTMTLYYLAQTYAKVDKRTLSAYYCHICLNRQIQAAHDHTNVDSDSTSEADGEQLDWREWVLNAMGLSVWYEEQLDWDSAWHCVKAAETVLARVKQGEVEHEVEKRRELAGEVDKSVACFYLKFLQHKPPAPATSTAASDSNSPPAKLVTPSTLQKPIRFTILSLPFMPCTHPLTLQTALPLFNAAYRHFQSALAAFPLDGYVTEHCQLLLDVAALYRSLVPFDAAHEAVYWKKAVGVLSRGLDGMSAVHFVELYREMSEELGNGYMALMDAKADGGAQKRNEYGLKAIHHYQLFADSFETSAQSGQGGPSQKQIAVERDDMYRYLLVQFTIARLYQRLWTDSVTAVCTFHRKSLEVLHRIVRLCREWECAELFASELALCGEMIELLPRKMEKMMRDGAAFRV